MSKIDYDQEFIGVTFNEDELNYRQFESCVFRNCNFSNIHFKNITFEGCEFYICDFSGAQINESALRMARFFECKLIGLNFESVNPFRLSLSFSNCQMDYTSFYKLKLKGTKFENCSLKGADFSEAILSEANFQGASLHEAVFQQTQLLKADFRGSVGYAIHPTQNSIKGARFSKEEVLGLLTNFGIRIE